MSARRVAIEALSDRGEGVAIVDGARRTVPLAAPGDTLVLEGPRPGLEPTSSERAEPPCPLFGRCGGCTLQHLSDEAYARFKVGRLERAFDAVRLSPSVRPMRRAPLASRRRATLTAVRAKSGPRIGYFAKGTHEVVDIKACPALAPPLAAALPGIRAVAQAMLGQAESARLVATLCDNGVDLAVELSSSRPSRRRRRGRDRASPLALGPLDPAIIRVSVDGEPALQHEAPVVRFGGVAVAFPPGAFLQASREGEAHLQDAVLAATEGARTIVDAFCGLGTFAIPLSERAKVLAVEADDAALSALRSAVAEGRCRTLRRDLQKHPLGAAELKGVDALVFDPPRAGAKPLAQELARSSVPTVVAVSCEPATLARDCAILAAGGFKITHVQPVDQFVATHHLEAVAVLRRPR